MLKPLFLILFGLLFSCSILNAQIEELELGSDRSRIPRLDRTKVIEPTQKQFLWDINSHSFWYYKGNNWIEIINPKQSPSTDLNLIADLRGDQITIKELPEVPCFKGTDIGIINDGVTDNTSTITNFVNANPGCVICLDAGDYVASIVADDHDFTVRGVEPGVNIIWNKEGSPLRYSPYKAGSLTLANLNFSNTSPDPNLSTFSIDVGTRGGPSDRYINASNCRFRGHNANPALDSINAQYTACVFRIKDDGPVAGMGTQSQNAIYNNCYFHGYLVLDCKSGNWVDCKFRSTGTYVVHHTAHNLDTDWDGVCNFTNCVFDAKGFVAGNAPGGHCNFNYCEFRGGGGIFYRFESTFNLNYCSFDVESFCIVASKYANPNYPNYVPIWNGVSKVRYSTFKSKSGHHFAVPDTDQRGCIKITNSVFDWNKILVSDMLGADVTTEESKKLYLKMTPVVSNKLKKL